MYLNLLDDKKKSLFLGLAYNVAHVDGNYSKEEEMMIQSYCQEMQVEFEIGIVKDTEDIVSDLITLCDNKEKKIVVFEIMGLAMIDGKYDSSEKRLIENMAEKFDIKNEFVGECEIEIAKYMKIQERINELVIK